MLNAQLTVLLSMTVPDCVIVHGPVYDDNVVPAGTPVFDAFGNPVDAGELLLVEVAVLDRV